MNLKKKEKKSLEGNTKQNSFLGWKKSFSHNDEVFKAFLEANPFFVVVGGGLSSLQSSSFP